MSVSKTNVHFGGVYESLLFRGEFDHFLRFDTKKIENEYLISVEGKFGFLLFVGEHLSSDDEKCHFIFSSLTNAETRYQSTLSTRLSMEFSFTYLKPTLKNTRIKMQNFKGFLPLIEQFSVIVASYLRY